MGEREDYLCPYCEQTSAWESCKVEYYVDEVGDSVYDFEDVTCPLCKGKDRFSYEHGEKQQSEEVHSCTTCGKLVISDKACDFKPEWVMHTFDCPEWRRMTEEDTIRCNEGACPYWAPKKCVDSEEKDE